MTLRFDQIARECRGTFNGNLEEMPIVGLEHIEPYDMLLKNWDVNVETTFTKEFHKGQIMFGRRRAYQHKACVATCDGICSGDITLIEPIEGMVYPDLLPFIVQNDDFFEHAIKGSNGALSPRVKWEHMANFEVNLPSLAEQKVLAEKLWAAYEVKQSYLKMIEATEDLVKSQFKIIFATKNGNAKLGDYVTIRTGKLDANAATDNGKYPFFSCSYDTLKIDTFAFDCEAVLLAGNGDFCVKYYNGKFNAYQRTYVIESKDKVSLPVEYLYYWMTYYSEILRKQAIGGLIKYIKIGYLTDAPFYLPSLNEINDYLKMFHQIDKTISELRKSIDAIDKVIKSLINENL